MNYKKAFWITLAVLICFIITWIIIPLCCGYTVGFLNGYQFTLENVYFVFSIIGVFVAIAVAVFTYKLYNRQIEIANKQTELSTQQTEISSKQTEIMKEQNRIALFKEKYECFCTFKNSYSYGLKAMRGRYKDGVNYSTKYQSTEILEIKYLFNEEIYKECHKILHSLFLLNEATEAIKTGSQTLLSMGATEENKTAHAENIKVDNFHAVCVKMEEYLKL